MNNKALRALWLAWALLLSMLVAGASGIVAFAASKDIADAVATSGATFGGTMTLLILILTFILPGDRR